MRHHIKSLLVLLFCAFVGLSSFVSGTLVNPPAPDNSFTINELQTELQQVQSDLTQVREEKQLLLTQQTKTLSAEIWQSVSDFSFLKELGYREIPLLRKSDYYEVKFTLNGQNCYLLLDTGASQTILDATRSARFKLPLVELPVEREYVGLGGKSTSVQTVLVKEMTVDDLVFDDVVFSVIDLGPINDLLTSQDAYPIDGLLGDDFLQSGAAVMDFENEKMYLKEDMDFNPFVW